MRKFFDMISLGGLNPNQLYLLYCIRECYEPENINVFLDARALKTMGYVDKELFLTDKGKSLLEDMESMLKSKPVKKTVTVDDDLVTAYLELWPKIKLPSGKYARSDKKNIANNLKWFMENHSYGPETILKATAAYIDEFAAENYKFMRTSQYFIRKTDNDKNVVSELANYCDMLENGSYEPPTNDFDDKFV